MKSHRTPALCGIVLTFALLVSSPAVAADKIAKVFFLVGQSNMEGKGNPVHLDTYKADPLIEPTYAGLKDGGTWRVRDDVWITYPTKSGGAKHGPLTVGYGTKGEDSIGPEFGFGHAVGNAVEEPVLLIKIAWGGKSLHRDFRPPSAAPSEAEIHAVIEQIETRNEKAKNKKSVPTPEEVQESYGKYYREMIQHAQAELDAIGSRFPELKDHRPEIAGFIWHQGFNDKIRRDYRATKYADYTTWLATFIKDVREDLGVPGMPFVIGELSTGGIPARGDFQIAQANTAKLPGFEGNVLFVPTAEYYDTEAHELYEQGFWKGTDQQKAQWQAVGNDRPYHYLGSGKTYYLKGLAFGEAVLKMQ